MQNTLSCFLGWSRICYVIPAEFEVLKSKRAAISAWILINWIHLLSRWDFSYFLGLSNMILFFRKTVSTLVASSPSACETSWEALLLWLICNSWMILRFIGTVSNDSDFERPCLDIIEAIIACAKLLAIAIVWICGFFEAIWRYSERIDISNFSSISISYLHACKDLRINSLLLISVFCCFNKFSLKSRTWISRGPKVKVVVNFFSPISEPN